MMRSFRIGVLLPLFALVAVLAITLAPVALAVWAWLRAGGAL